MKDQATLDPYFASLQEIRSRYNFIRSLSANERDAIHDVTQLETIILQFRMIFELIPLASLAAHASVYEEYQAKFRKKWRPKEILDGLEKLNPNFYPIPLVRMPSYKPGGMGELEIKDDGYLTREELVKAHGICGNLLHARNPYGKEIDYDFFHRKTFEWSHKIIELLSVHKIQLLNADRFDLIQLVDNDLFSHATYVKAPPA